MLRREGMKNLKKIFVTFMLLLVGMSFAFAGGKKEKEIELTEEQKAEGWRYFAPLGIKIKRPAFWDEFPEDNLWSDVFGEEYDAPNDPVFKAYDYSYATDAVLAADEEIYQKYLNKELTLDEAKELWDKTIPPMLKRIYGLFTLRTKIIEGKDLKEITHYPINKVLNKDKEYTQVLGMAEFNGDGLNEKEAANYKKMLSQVMPASETITCVKPKTASDFMRAIEGLKFDTVDLEGNRVTSDILKNYDVTMINIWATWCGPCRGELPDIAKLYEKFKDKNCNIIGITADVSPDNQGSLETAKKLTNDAGCKYTILQNNDSLKPLFKGVVAFPTTIFVDKNGNVIASSHKDIIIGGRDLEGFTEAFENALNAVK